MQAKTDNHRLIFETELENMIDLDHPLVKLAQQIDWANFEKQFGVLYDEGIGRPAKPIRLMVGLQYLKYTFNFSDEQLVYAWIENPYWQYFCGEKYFQHKLPIEPTSMTKWRNRVKDSGLETLLEETVKAGLKIKVIKKTDTKKLVVDTTVQEKNITFPTDAKLCFKAREILVELASVLGVERLSDVYVDEGYKGHGCGDIAEVTVVKRGWRKNKRSEKRWLKRRSSIEPTIGHLKQDNRLCRNYLKGIKGDKANAILSACGYNMRKLLRKFIFALIYLGQILKEVEKLVHPVNE